MGSEGQLYRASCQEGCLLLDLGGMSVTYDTVGLEGLVELTVCISQVRLASRSGNTRYGIDYYRACIDQALFKERSKCYQ